MARPTDGRLVQRRRPVWMAAAAVAGFVLAGAPVAAAAPTWLTPVDLSAADASSSGAQVLMDREMRSVAVWEGPGDVIQLGLRSPGAPFGAPADLTVGGADVAAPQVSADYVNDVVVWERNNGADDIVQTARLLYEGDIDPTVDLSAPGHDAHHPQVAASKDIGVVWERSDGTNTIVQAATQERDEDNVLSAFSAPVDLSAAGQDALDPHIANEYGSMIAVWRRYDGTNWRIQASTRPNGGSFSAPADLSAAGGDAMSPRVVTDDLHHASVVWRRFDGTHWIAQAAALPATNPIAAPTSFFSPVDVSADDVDALDPDLAIAGGDTTIVWRAVDGADNIVQAVERFGDGTFSATADLSAAESNAFAPKVSADWGVAVVWQALDGSNNVVRAVQRSRGESFSTPVDVSAPGDDAVEPRVASYFNEATVVWQRNGSDQVIQAAGLDVDGPVFSFAFFPMLSSGVGTVGVPVSFVRPVATDTWSALGQSTWGFGDGTSSTSTAQSISHTYTRTGTFNVTVDIHDVLGHVGPRTADDFVTINSAPPPPPPPPLPPPAAPVLALTHLRLAPASFRTARTGSSTTRSAARRSGTRVRYGLNAAASVRFSVQRAVAGRRTAAGCAKRTNANGRRKTCTRYLPVSGAFTRKRAAGADAFTFTGRVAAHRLRPGRYRLVAKATAGPRSDSTAAGFRILRAGT